MYEKRGNRFPITNDVNDNAVNQYSEVAQQNNSYRAHNHFRVYSSILEGVPTKIN